MDSPEPLPEGVRLTIDAAADRTTANRADRQGDPAELAPLDLAADLDTGEADSARDTGERTLFRFDPRIKLMSVAQVRDGRVVLHTKGAPEGVLARADRVLGMGEERGFAPEVRAAVVRAVGRLADRGLLVLAVARRGLPPGRPASQPGRPPDGPGLDPDDRVGHLDRLHKNALHRGEQQLIQLRPYFVHGMALLTTPHSGRAIFGRLQPPSHEDR